MLLTDIKFGDEISVTLFSDIAQRCANEIKSHQEKKDTNKRTQLRHFYDELVMWHDKVFQSVMKKNAIQHTKIWLPTSKCSMPK